MSKLKLGAIDDDKPVRLAVELPATLHRDLVAYAQALGRETGQSVAEPAKLIAPMLARFMATDRSVRKDRAARVSRQRPATDSVRQEASRKLANAGFSLSALQWAE